MFLLGVPLLIFPIAIYNILAFLMPGFSWTQEIWHFRMKSEGDWGLTAGDLMVAGSILVLLIEMFKSARMTGRTVMDHVLSMILFTGMLAEFVMVKEAASTTFFLLLVIAAVDVVGGFAVGGRAPRRDVSASEVENVDTAT